ncbi:MAG: insulinase family protein [Bacteroidales bacterium]|nr:insulinase family protein [Bacteroidales bacterium]
MKRFISVVSAALLLLAGASCSRYSYETVKGDPTGTRIYTLENGLKVYATVNRDEPRIEAYVAVRVGSKNDPRETTGLAHYFEHLMFKGTNTLGTIDYEAEKPMLDTIEALFEVYRRTEDPAERKALYARIDSISYEASKLAVPNEYDKLMASLGSNGSNAFTSQDVTCYTENIPSNQLELWAEAQADRFQNCVLRGFHTELETIYEEFNMSDSRDFSKAVDAMLEGLFEKHPYRTSVIGYPAHLKNPSITNVRKYHDEWYVPNNMAVILSGDFDPDKAIRIIDRHFGAMKPNPDLKQPEFEPEAPIAAPVVKELRGNESPFALLAWRFPGAADPNCAVLKALAKVLYNGKAGLVDIDVNQEQKTLGMFSSIFDNTDYNALYVISEPKPGQTLEDVRDVILEEIEKLKTGDFDESLLEATINNLKLDYMKTIESAEGMAYATLGSFVAGTPWSETVGEIDRIAAITKEDIVKYACETLGDNYVFVKKLQGEPDLSAKIDKPAITPICTNRDTASVALKDFQARAALVKPIEPHFLDYEKDLSRLEAKSGIEVLYKKNVTNGTFELDYVFETGRLNDKKLSFACDYLDYLGTSKMTPAEVKKYLYSLACDFSVSCSDERTYVSLNGLAENMDKVMAFMEEFIADAQPNPEALELLKANTIQDRMNARTSQNANSFRLRNYALYGPVNPSTYILSNKEIMALTDAELLDTIRNLFTLSHSVIYYGPVGADEFVAGLNAIHKCPETLVPVKSGNPFRYLEAEENTVIVAPYDANQSVVVAVSCSGEPYDASLDPKVQLYNGYFGAGAMNCIVFQEMREARGLAYSAYASYTSPSDKEHPMHYRTFIQTQNDKVVDALAAFADITDNMPESQAAFDIAKEDMLANLRTRRVIKSDVLWSYVNDRKLGLDSDRSKLLYEGALDLTLDDIVKFQQEAVKGRKYTISILGRESDLDMERLSGFGKIKRITTTELFGY